MFYDHFIERKKATNLGKKFFNLYSNNIFQIVSKYKRNQNRLLEIGPGKGVFAELCKSNGINYVGVDGNELLCLKMKEKGFKIFNAMVPPMKFIESGSFDLIVADQVIEHMPTFREALDLLKEFYRILDNSGIVVLGFPNYLASPRIFFDLDYSHSFVTTQRRVSDLLYDCGFSTVLQRRLIGPFSNLFVKILIKSALSIIQHPSVYYTLDAIGRRSTFDRICKTFTDTIIMVGQKIK